MATQYTRDFDPAFKSHNFIKEIKVYFQRLGFIICKLYIIIRGKSLSIDLEMKLLGLFRTHFQFSGKYCVIVLICMLIYVFTYRLIFSLIQTIWRLLLDILYGWTPGMVGLAPKWVRLAPNGTNPGIFRSDFSAFGGGRQIHWNLIWKSPGFVPFVANLTHFGAKPTIPG